MSLEAKHKALDDLAGAHVELKEAALRIPEEKLNDALLGGWSVKDVIAHVSSWDELASLDVHRLARGHVPVLSDYKSAEADDWNASLMRGRTRFSPGQIYYELESCYDMLIEALETVPEAMYDGRTAVTDIVRITEDHYRQHAGNIREWRERQGL